jgi:hypothetical protein
LAAANPVTDVFGNTRVLTGLQMYVRVNQVLVGADESTVDTAPANLTVTGPATLTVVASAPSTLTLTWTSAPMPSGNKLYIFATRGSSPGRLPEKKASRFIGASGVDPGSPFAAGTLYTNRLGSLEADKLVAVFMAGVNTSNGAVSPFVIGSTVVA